MTLSFIGNEQVVAKVYDPETDYEYLFTNMRLAQVFFQQMLKYNTIAPVLFEEEI